MRADDTFHRRIIVEAFEDKMIGITVLTPWLSRALPDHGIPFVPTVLPSLHNSLQLYAEPELFREPDVQSLKSDYVSLRKGQLPSQLHLQYHQIS